MAEYIEREEVYKNACKGCKNHGIEVGSCFSEEPCEVLILAFVNAPSADVVPVRHGRWDGGYTKTSDGEWVYSTPKCTVCGSKSNGGTTNFCPYCGCKMLEDSDGKK